MATPHSPTPRLQPLPTVDSLLIYPLLTHPCNSIDITHQPLSQLIYSDIIIIYRHTTPIKIRFSQSCQLPVPVEKDLWIKTSWTLIDLMWTPVTAITLNNPSLPVLLRSNEPAPYQCEINYEDCLLQIASTHIIDTVIAHQSSSCTGDSAVTGW